MLIPDTVRCRLYLRIDQLRPGCHFSNLLQNYCVMHCFSGILPPCERSVILTQNARCMHRIQSPFLEGFNDHQSRILFIGCINLLRCQTSGTWNLPEEIIGMSGSI